MNIQYQPKGSMCAVCAHKDRNCSDLLFEYMKPVIGSFDVQTKTKLQKVSVVKCAEFIKET